MDPYAVAEPWAAEGAAAGEAADGSAAGAQASGMTARFLLADLRPGTSREDVVDYFGACGEIEDASVRELTEGRVVGSVKFANPTLELRTMMLKQQHVINGSRVTVSTWKMQKNGRPGNQGAKGQQPAAGWQGGGKGMKGPSSYGFYGKDASGGYGKDAYGGYGKDASGGYGKDGYSSYGHYGYSYDKGAGKQMDWSWGPYGKGCWDAGCYGYGGKDRYGGNWGKNGKGSCAGKGDKYGKDGDGKNKDITARYLLQDLPDELDEQAIRTYFSVFGELEEVSLKKHETTGKTTGSVKFASPTAELREQMLKEAHVINGHTAQVQTWKMQKMQKPGYAKQREAETAKYFAKIGKPQGLITWS